MITAEQADKFLKTQLRDDAYWAGIVYQIKTLKGDARELGLLIFNQLEEYHPPAESSINYYYENYPPRLEAIKKLIEADFHGKDIWQGDYYKLLEIIVGSDSAPYVKRAWGMLSEGAYQTAYYRRSFRAPNNPEKYSYQKISFLMSLREAFDYKLSLADYARYSGFKYNPYHRDLSLILAATIDEGNTEIKNTLLDLIAGKDEIGVVNEVSIRALMLSHDKECWDKVEQLLLNAQREEGLRQIILEALDETSIGAMHQLLGTIIEHDLVRFSSVVRALDVWIGVPWESMRLSAVKRSLQFAYDFLQNPDSISVALKDSKDYVELYMALWASGVLDVDVALEHVQSLLNNSADHEGKRQLALYFLLQTGSGKRQRQIAWPTIHDKSDAVLVWALKNVSELEQDEFSDAFTQLEGLLTRIPKKGVIVVFKPFNLGGWELNPLSVYELLLALSDKTPAYWPRIINWYADINRSDVRKGFAKVIFEGYFTIERWRKDDIKPKDTIAPLSDFQQRFAFSVLQDKSPEIREIARESLSYGTFNPAEKNEYEEQLKGGNSAVRQALQNMLEKQSKDQLKNSIEMLLYASSKNQRLAALEMIKRLQNDLEWKEFIADNLAQYQQQVKLTSTEKSIIQDLIDDNSFQQEYTLVNGFGLYDPEKLTPVEQPKKPESGYFVEHILGNANNGSVLSKLFKKKEEKSPFSQSLKQVREHLDDLAKLVEQHRDAEIIVESYDGSKESILLGACERLPELKRRFYQEDEDKDAALKNWQNLALYEVWEHWYQQTGMTSIDIHLLIKYFETEFSAIYDMWGKGQRQNLDIMNTYPKPFGEIARDIVLKPFHQSLMELSYAALIKSIIDSLGSYCFDRSCREVNRDATEWVIASIPESHFNTEFNVFKNNNEPWIKGYWDAMPTRDLWLYETGAMLDFKRFWKAYNWAYRTRRDVVDKPYFGQLSYDYFDHICEAYKQQLVSYDELFSAFIANVDTNSNRLNFFSENGVHVKKLFKRYPFLQKLVADFCERIIDIELKRGDAPTDATGFATNISKIYGIKRFQEIVTAIGKKSIRDNTYGDEKTPVFMRMLKACRPHKNETQEDFNHCLKTLKLADDRLVEIAMFARQWQPFIAGYLGWSGMESGIAWFDAHAAQYQSEEREARIGKYSTIALDAFQDGAVDVVWFKDAYAQLGKKNWGMLYKFAKFTDSYGNGHVRAKLFADAMLGNVGIRVVTKKIEDKRNKNNVMAYGLLALSKANPDNDMLNRYELLQTFLKESKQFGSQRQRSEARAVEVAIENLARTAGYAEPLHFIWNMEASQTRKILEQAQQVKIDDLIIDLVITPQGKAQFAVQRGDKVLKNIPVKHGKNKQVVKLKEYLKKLNLQARRARKSLEDAMVRGDIFPFKEIEKLMQHPIVAPMLKQLIFITDENKLGFWQDASLVSADGEQHKLKKKSTLRIAHCADLYNDGNWSSYQHHCFQNKLIQPFKQIFRELYRVTADELAKGNTSNRYAGHQVKPKQTVALLKSRGWIVDYEEGLMKVDHQHGLIGSIYAMADWFTPAETEYPALETIQFNKRGKYKSVPLKDIPERVFSEFMRDVDLVVSVAHAGGVDPETSQSSIEMRQVLVNETAQLFKFENVQVDKNHIKIVGKLAEYSLHLGSGIIHRMPGGHIAVIPVHAQHRGRLFLPFMDDDPKSAEILSKMVMLANDHKIKDPTILEQIQDIRRK